MTKPCNFPGRKAERKVEAIERLQAKMAEYQERHPHTWHESGVELEQSTGDKIAKLTKIINSTMAAWERCPGQKYTKKLVSMTGKRKKE